MYVILFYLNLICKSLILTFESVSRANSANIDPPPLFKCNVCNKAFSNLTLTYHLSSGGGSMLALLARLTLSKVKIKLLHIELK